MALTSPLPITVAAVAVLLAGVAVLLVAAEAPSFWDPCMEWGQGSDGGGGGSLTLAPGDGCPSRSSTSETKAEAAGRLALVDGGTFAASALGFAGAWRRSALPLVLASLVMAGVTVLLFFGLSVAFALTLGAAVLYGVAAARWRGRRGRRPASEGS